MDPLIIAEKLESLRRCVRRVEARRPATAVALANDVDAQDILALNLTRAVQWCVDMAIVLAMASVGLADFRDFARAIAKGLSRPQ